MVLKNLDCYVLPGVPLPLILPVECVTAVLQQPEIEVLSEAPASWMHGYVTWENQRLPVLSYSALHDASFEESKYANPCLVILNPIPDAARKAFAGLICFGEVKQLKIDPDIVYGNLPTQIDRRYVTAVVRMGEQRFIIPNLAALEVAFSYF